MPVPGLGGPQRKGGGASGFGATDRGGLPAGDAGGGLLRLAVAAHRQHGRQGAAFGAAEGLRALAPQGACASELRSIFWGEAGEKLEILGRGWLVIGKGSESVDFWPVLIDWWVLYRFLANELQSDCQSEVVPGGPSLCLLARLVACWLAWWFGCKLAVGVLASARWPFNLSLDQSYPLQAGRFCKTVVRTLIAGAMASFASAQAILGSTPKAESRAHTQTPHDPVLHADFGDLSYFSCNSSKHGVLLSTSHPDPSTRPPPQSPPHPAPSTHPHATHPHPSPPPSNPKQWCTEAGLEELRGLLLRQTWILWPEDSVELQQRRGGG